MGKGTAFDPNDQGDAAAVRVFPPGVPALTILFGVVLNRLWPIHLGFDFPAPWRYWLGGLIVAGAIFGFGLWSVVLFRRSGQSENPWKPTPDFNCDESEVLPGG